MCFCNHRLLFFVCLCLFCFIFIIIFFLLSTLIIMTTDCVCVGPHLDASVCVCEREEKELLLWCSSCCFHCLKSLVFLRFMQDFFAAAAIAAVASDSYTRFEGRSSVETEVVRFSVPGRRFCGWCESYT